MAGQSTDDAPSSEAEDIFAAFVRRANHGVAHAQEDVPTRPIPQLGSPGLPRRRPELGIDERTPVVEPISGIVARADRKR